MPATSSRALLASPSDLALRVGADSGDARIDLALRRASDRFRAAVGHSVSSSTADTVVLDGTGTDTLHLPGLPVQQVRTVAVSGALVTDWALSPRLGVLRRVRAQQWPVWYRYDEHRYWGSIWPDGLGNVEVVYDHGFAEVPGDIADAVLEQAELQFTVLAGVQQASLGPQSVTFGAQAAVGVTARWSEAVARYQVGVGDRP